MKISPPDTPPRARAPRVHRARGGSFMKNNTGKNVDFAPVAMSLPRAPRRGGTQCAAGICAALFILTAPLSAIAGESSIRPGDPVKPGRQDITLGNFFSVGWNEPWQKYPRGQGTPDMSLLRVQTNFLAQLFRTDLAIQENRAENSVSDNTLLTGTLEYAFNRRFMLALIGNYRWLDSRAGEDNEGGAVAAFARFQLLENRNLSLAFTFRAGLPNHDLREKNTTLGFAFAGWQDLEPLGLGRTGLYYHVQEETLAGPAKPGARHNALTYDISLARTWTKPDAWLGNATTFVEGYGRTDLDGEVKGQTLITITPGVRATIAHRHIVMAGVEFPLTDERPFDRTLRFTYIYNF